MVHDLNPKNLHTNGLIFFVKSKKNPYFQGIFGHYPENSGQTRFLALKAP